MSKYTPPSFSTFYDKHYAEIEEMREEYEESTGEPLQIKNDLKLPSLV